MYFNLGKYIHRGKSFHLIFWSYYTHTHTHTHTHTSYIQTHKLSYTQICMHSITHTHIHSHTHTHTHTHTNTHTHTVSLSLPMNIITQIIQIWSRNLFIIICIFQEGRTTSPSLAGSVNVHKLLDGAPDSVHPYHPTNRQILMPIPTKTEVTLELWYKDWYCWTRKDLYLSLPPSLNLQPHFKLLHFTSLRGEGKFTDFKIS